MGIREIITGKRREALAREGFVSRDPSVEALEHEERERQRLDDYVVGLRRERMGVELEAMRLRQLRPESRTWQPGDDLARGEPPTVSERIIAAEGRIAAIDAEIERVSG